ncbi:tyrosine--tRNA ligase [Lacihabitans sp. LS3-19]|uniref:tyrosine--tRNA ligase n=1 Tax=Lacihabitans sp. LS3-19 TaxID=2487335 RepID=UPI0020CDCF49|nr:tyrosine--tRNA ligase [Lacihabitans sp. LS3-19]MCP9768054.1 tyrosine--tRNA ligase [Lacihabitans sp. LS3-19]
MNFIEELKWRGMLHQMMPGTEEQLDKEMTSAYIGFDPTAKSLHIGNLATIMLLVHLQRAGHKPYALVGGATGMVGDPSGKSSERQFLDEKILRENQEGIRKQLEKFLSFNAEANSAEMVNNYDWFKDFGFLQFLREVGKYLTVNYMSSKDSVKNRITTGISYTEFTYQLLQGYDFYHLYKHKGVKIQMGGSDQWGNITTGTELIRRKENNDGSDAEGDVEYSAYALTTPLVTKSDGTKFGKSEGGNVWLDPDLTSPYEFFQFWINQTDDDCKKLIRVFTLLSKEEIESLEAQHAEAPHLRIVQKAIAKDVTTRVHGAEQYELAVKASEVLYGKATLETLQSLDEATFKKIFDGVPQTTISKAEFDACPSFLDLISVTTKGEIYTSKGEAKRALQGNAVSINKEKQQDEKLSVSEISLLAGKYILIGKGKKNHIVEVG